MFLSSVLQRIRLNRSRIEFWPLYGQNALPHLRLRTLTDLSVLFSSSFIRAIFVRHPFERLASAYVDKIGTLKTEPRSLYDTYRREVCRRFASYYLSAEDQRAYHLNQSLENQLNEPCAKVIPRFEHFVEHMLHERLQGDVHWQPYSNLCQACLVKYNFIGKYETIQEDLKFFKGKLGLNTADWDKEIFFATGKTQENYKLMYSKLSKDLLCHLQDFYRNDLKLFHYRVEDYWPKKKDIHCASPQHQ